MITTIKKRADFLALRGAKSAGTRSFLMVAGKRPLTSRIEAQTIRVGFTVTKKQGNAVRRNRIRRRLREAARHILLRDGRPGYDYVLIARPGAFGRKFDALLDDVAAALLRLGADTK